MLPVSCRCALKTEPAVIHYLNAQPWPVKLGEYQACASNIKLHTESPTGLIHTHRIFSVRAEAEPRAEIC